MARAQRDAQVRLEQVCRAGVAQLELARERLAGGRDHLHQAARVGVRMRIHHPRGLGADQPQHQAGIELVLARPRAHGVEVADGKAQRVVAQVVGREQRERATVEPAALLCQGDGDAAVDRARGPRQHLPFAPRRRRHVQRMQFERTLHHGQRCDPRARRRVGIDLERADRVGLALAIGGEEAVEARLGRQ